MMSAHRLMRLLVAWPPAIAPHMLSTESARAGVAMPATTTAAAAAAIDALIPDLTRDPH